MLATLTFCSTGVGLEPSERPTGKPWNANLSPRLPPASCVKQIAYWPQFSFYILIIVKKGPVVGYLHRCPQASTCLWFCFGFILVLCFGVCSAEFLVTAPGALWILHYEDVFKLASSVLFFANELAAPFVRD